LPQCQNSRTDPAAAAARGALFQGLRGARSEARAAAALATDLHHVFPDAKKFLAFFKKNNINVNGVKLAMNGYLHRFGLHGVNGAPNALGGAYNQAWEEFMGKNSGMQDNPYYVIGFGFGLIERINSKLILPFDGL
jgi:hypothetical protein